MYFDFIFAFFTFNNACAQFIYEKGNFWMWKEQEKLCKTKEINGCNFLKQTIK